MSWTSANILTGENYSACRDCWRSQVRKGGKFPGVARLPPQECVCFRGLCRDGRLPFRRGTRSESSFRTSWKVPQNIFPWSLSPLFLADGAGFSADTGADEQESAEKKQARDDASAGASLTHGLPAVFLRKELCARGSEERGDSESPLRHAKRRRGGKRDLGGKNLTEKGAVTHHHSSLKFWSG